MIRMKVLVFRMVYGLLRVFASLPLSVLYAISGPACFLMRRVFHYRRRVVFDNLRRAFPQKDEKEIHRIAGAFYHHLANLLVETIKVMDFSQDELSARIRFRNRELIDRYFEQGRSVVAVSAHYGNWEWLQGLAGEIRHHPVAVYKPLSDKRMNEIMNRQRSRFGAEMVSMRDIIRTLRRHHRQGRPTLTMFISDQSPVWEEIQYWTPFMNQLTPVYLGPEKIAREFGMAVVFFRMHVLGRGSYEVEIVPVCENAKAEKEFAITGKHVGILQETIEDNPGFWLWSHRRWKLTRKREREEARGRYKFEGQFIRKPKKRIADA